MMNKYDSCQLYAYAIWMFVFKITNAIRYNLNKWCKLTQE